MALGRPEREDTGTPKLSRSAIPAGWPSVSPVFALHRGYSWMKNMEEGEPRRRDWSLRCDTSRQSSVTPSVSPVFNLKVTTIRDLPRNPSLDSPPPVTHHAATNDDTSGCALGLVVEDSRVVCLDAGSTTPSTGYVKFAQSTRLPRRWQIERIPSFGLVRPRTAYDDSRSG